MAVPSVLRSSSVQHILQALTKAEQIRDKPARRLQAARELYELAQGCDDLQYRLNALQESVKLDPFQIAYRLSLAQVEQECGLWDAAIAEYRSALEIWEEDKVRLLLAEALLQKGEVAKAREQLKAVVGNDASIRGQLEFDLIECHLREGKWDDAVAALEKIDEQLFPDFLGLFLEKCIKLILELQDKEKIERTVTLVTNKAPSDSPALQFVRDIAEFDPNKPKRIRDDFGSLFCSYKLSTSLSLRSDSQNFANLAQWKDLLTRYGDTWPGLQDAYVSLLDEWAQQAYKSKKLKLATVLWEEAANLKPYHPPLLNNLAIVRTRQKDESGSQWYWDKAAQSWVLFSEMWPEADGYKQSLIQKHRAFAEGAQTKLNTVQQPQELIELGFTWIKEAISYFALFQLEYRNPYFRLGVRTSDFAGDEEREEVVRTAYKSSQEWLELVAQWEGLGKDSSLAQWRSQRLTSAYEDVSKKKDPYRFYDAERDSFIQYREFITQQYVMLLFGMLIRGAAEKLDVNNVKMCEHYHVIVQGLLSFPHELLKPGVLKAVQQLDPETDLRALIQNQAAGPWASPAQQLMEKKRPELALPLLEKLVEAVPGFVPGMFLLARCYAETENFNRAFEILSQARQWIEPGDEMEEHIENFAQQMDMARVNKRLRRVQERLGRDDATGALADCNEALKEYPDHPYILFVMAQVYVAQADVEAAIKSLTQARKHCQGNEELLETIEKNLNEIKEHAGEVILSRAVPLMQAENWTRACEFLRKGRSLKPPDARLTFYEAVCLAKLGNETEAEKVAKKALTQCGNDYKLQAEIENFIPQIAVAAIAEELGLARQAMDKKRWSSAIQYLDAAEAKASGSVLVLFYLTICHFQLEHWDTTEKYAKQAIRKCTDKHADIKDQLNLILDQLEIAPVKGSLDKAQKAIERQRWKDALPHIDAVLSKSPNNPLGLFFQALCYFRLERWDEAENAANKASRYTTKQEHQNIESQLQDLLRAIPQARNAKHIAPIIQLIKKEDFVGALKKVDQALRSDSYNPDLHFFRAVCNFRKTMNDINARRVTPYTSLFSTIDDDLNQAKLSSDPSIRSQAQGLQQNIESVKQQIRSAGYY